MAELRKWQKDFFRVYLEANPSRFLLQATPGAGKTVAALSVAKALLSEGVVDRVVVVSNTQTIRKQWAKVAIGFGIELEEAPHRCSEEEDCQGASICYSALTVPGVAKEQSYRVNGKTFVILDEMHHLAEESKFGFSAKMAFEKAGFVLGLSGTPWRTKSSEKIPFLPYEEVNGGYQISAEVTFNYSYKEALSDGVVAPVYFDWVDGPVRWLSDSGDVDDRLYVDDGDTQKQSRRLRTAIDVSESSGILLDILTVAIKRRDSVGGVGLIVCDRQQDAVEIHRMLKLLHCESDVIVSEDTYRMAELEAYTEGLGSNDWIVSVGMVTEGVDIPNCNVLAWLTCRKTELVFDQLVGRLVRGENRVFAVIPKSVHLYDYAKKIEEAKQVIVKEKPEAGEREHSGSFDQGLFFPTGSEADSSGVVHGGRDVDQEVFDRAMAFVNEAKSLTLDDAIKIAECTIPKEGKPQPQARKKTKTERKSSLRKIAHRLAGSLAGVLCQKRGMKFEDAVSLVHTSWVKRGGVEHKRASESDLERKKVWLEKCIVAGKVLS